MLDVADHALGDHLLHLVHMVADGFGEIGEILDMPAGWIPARIFRHDHQATIVAHRLGRGARCVLVAGVEPALHFHVVGLPLRLSQQVGEAADVRRRSSGGDEQAGSSSECTCSPH